MDVERLTKQNNKIQVIQNTHSIDDSNTKFKLCRLFGQSKAILCYNKHKHARAHAPQTPKDKLSTYINKHWQTQTLIKFNQVVFIKLN